MKQEMMGWQWLQLDHMQIICTSLRQISTPAPHYWIFYRLDALPDAQPMLSKHWGLSWHYTYTNTVAFCTLRLLLVITQDVQPVMHVTEAIFLGSLEDLREGH